MKNAVNREIPDYIEGYGRVKPYAGAFANLGGEFKKAEVVVPRGAQLVEDKVCCTIDEVLDKLPLKDGMTVSFHHHLRNGDYVTNTIMLALAKRGIRDIHLAASGLFSCHDFLAQLIEDGTITQISTNTFSPGKITEVISKGGMKKPAILRSHGGRARAIESGELHIDIAFIAAPSCDTKGNINGIFGKAACGCLSYAYEDAKYADYVVAITDNIVLYPNIPVEISENYVDYIVEVDAIGDPAGIVSGATRVATDPVQLDIAKRAADLLEECGFIKEGMSLQTGAGGISLAVAEKIRDKMKEKGIQGSFGSGGIHKFFIEMLEDNLLRALWNVQCFDLETVNHMKKQDPRHLIMGASLYGNMENKSCIVNNLDIMILGGFEVDTKFNLNVNTGSNGFIRSASGGNEDCAAGSKIAIVVSNLMKKGNRCIVKKDVLTVTTPGETIDCLVTDKGIAINPRRKDLLEKLKGTKLPIVSIEELYQMGEAAGAVHESPVCGEKIVGVVEYRDGTVIDVIRQVE